MTANNSYRFHLDKSSRKFRCPGCGEKRLVRYVDSETGYYVAENFGRCDRENRCQYHERPDFSAIKRPISDLGRATDPPPKEPDYVSVEFVGKSMDNWEKTNFAKFLIEKFGFEKAKEAAAAYFLGRSRQFNGKASIFWQIDKEERVRTGKILAYDETTGKRLKNENSPLTNYKGEQVDCLYIHKQIKKDFNLSGTFFGCHLLEDFPEKKVCIVESEKTAVICSILIPQYNWLATGGKTGIKIHEYSVYSYLKGKTVVMFPDFGKPSKQGITPFLRWKEDAQHIHSRISLSLKVSDYLESNLPDEWRDYDIDLADVLMNPSQYRFKNGKIPFE